MSLLLGTRSEPSKISTAVLWFPLLWLKGLLAAEQPDGAGPTLSKREDQLVSGGIFQPKFVSLWF